MRLLTKIEDLRGIEGCVCVPTMGALHAGHEALIAHGAYLARASGVASGCVATIFVNPTQFNDQKDFQRYPRTLDDDLAICDRAGASAVFAPSPEAIYPSSAKIRVPPLPQVATQPGLEDAHRPGHFAGVCQVVLRLFDLVRPSQAVFGEKDWQQLAVIRAMTLEEGLGIDIFGYPTIRETDGLAMSSRNRFLSVNERAAALSISRALRETGYLQAPSHAESKMREIVSAAGLDVEYAVVRDAASLLPVTFTPNPRPRRALIAARAGATRLIDNAAWPGGW
jgi:pantoate--beta-alanine ligase